MTGKHVDSKLRQFSVAPQRILLYFQLEDKVRILRLKLINFYAPRAIFHNS